MPAIARTVKRRTPEESLRAQLVAFLRPTARACLRQTQKDKCVHVSMFGASPVLLNRMAGLL